MLDLPADMPFVTTSLLAGSRDVPMARRSHRDRGGCSRCSAATRRTRPSCSPTRGEVETGGGRRQPLIEVEVELFDVDSPGYCAAGLRSAEGEVVGLIPAGAAR